jgi:hypothetical protein
MKVKELIEKLQAFDPEEDVGVYVQCNICSEFVCEDAVEVSFERGCGVYVEGRTYD